MKKLGTLLDGFENLPELGNVRTLLAGRHALILAPHPDDESLGCGGLIAAACAAGLPPAVVILTDGSASHPGSREFPPARLRGVREAEARRALKILGLPQDRILFLRQPDTRLAASDKTLGQIEAFARRLDCGLVIGPWAGDPHCDHQAAAGIAAMLAGTAGWNLLSYPVWGWLRDRNEVFDEPRNAGYRLNIAMHLQRKQQAIAAHRSQYGELIQDSPTGFRLPGNLLAVFNRPFEVYIA